MAKKIIYIVSTCLLLAYMFFAISFIAPKADKKKICDKLEIKIEYSGDLAYFTEEGIKNMVAKKGLNPEGKSLSEINTFEIEDFFRKNKLVKNAECYKTIDGAVKLKVYQRMPMFRVMSNTDDFYIDEEREIMPVPNNFAAYVPLATGYIDEEYAKNELFMFVQFLQKNKYWGSQIEQIYIHKNKDIELTPKKGNHQILLGNFDSYKENFEKLELFYKKGLDNIGWNRYSLINLKFADRVICTKR